MSKLTPIYLLATLTLIANAAALTQEDADFTRENLPDIARQLIDEAAKKGDVASITAVADATKAVLPSFSQGIEAYSALKVKSVLASANDTPTVSDPSVQQVADASEAVAETASDEVADAAASAEAPTVKTGLFSLEPWEGRISASLVNSSGNSQNTSAGILLDAKRTTGKFDKYTHHVIAFFDVGNAGTIAVDADGNNVVDEDGDFVFIDTLNQRRWGASYQVDYALSDRLNVFARIAYDEDQFSGFDYRLFGNAGIGYFVRKSEPLTWKIDAGPGYRLSPIDFSNETISEFALYAASDIDWVIRDGLTFTSDIGVVWTSPTTTIEATHGLSADLWGGFVAGVSYYYRFETSPPPGNVNTDTVLRATLGYAF